MFKEEKEKKLFMIGMSIVLVLVLLIGGTYAWLTLSLRGTKVNVLKAGNLSLILNDENSIGINQEKAVPMLDEVGEQLDPYHFTLENQGDQASEYTIFLDDIDLEENETRMADDKIKYNLIKDEEKTTALLSTTGENPNRILDTGVIKGGQTITYDLRLWIDKDASNEVMGQVLRTKIRVVAVQTEEILEDAPEECFAFDSTTGTITDYLCVEGNTSNLPVLTKFAIPSTINEVAVTSIENSAFYKNNLTKIAIPEGVTSIGSSAFAYNQLTNIKIPNSVISLKSFAFYENELMNVILSENITTIEGSAFRSNNLKSIIIPNKVISIGTEAFEDNQLESVTMPEGLTTIGVASFRGNKLKQLNIPSSVHTIGWSAFHDNQLENVIIPSSVTSLGYAAFANNHLPDEEAFIFGRNSDGTVNTSILNSYGGSTKDTVIIPDSVTSIDQRAFMNCQIQSVKIPEGVISIGMHAFYNNQLKSITIPNGITTLEAYVFQKNKLNNIVIPETITSIGDSAFADNNLTAISIPNSITKIESGTFRNNQLKSITIPDSITSIGTWAFCNNQLASISIPTSVTKISSGAFAGNQLPDDQAFVYNRNSDGSVDTTSLNSYGGVKRSNVVIPNGITKIGAYAFYYDNITSITLPDSVESIESYAFHYNNLTTVTIPKNISNIGSSAFYKSATHNPNLTKIINKTGRSFDWKSITGGSEVATFVTGTVVHSLGNITVSAS